jgi:hypothetical protein
MEITGLRYYTASSLSNIRLFYVNNAETALVQTMMADWAGGLIEAHSATTLITIADGTATQYGRKLSFDIHGLTHVAGSVALLNDAVHDWYGHELSVVFTDNMIYTPGEFTFGTSAHYHYGDFTIRDNMNIATAGSSTIGFVNKAQKQEGGYFVLLDSGGNSAISSNTLIENKQSDVTIYGNSTSAVTITALEINGQAVTPILPFSVKSGETFKMTYSGGNPVVIKK